ncbi:GNAT family N-acetyltransferase [Streptomyces sp. NPDC058067]|uniref:GNAT family N-acetyltransferase n=1 Tax=Streptomyces sp. NPDC058067 TaxID=3346324 RepID=UPI0036EAD503
MAACREGDLAALDRHLPSPSHPRRYARQLAGLGTLLVAWDGGQPVGHCEVRWDGCAAAEVRGVVGDCPEVNGLLVWPEGLRRHGIGTALITTAEDLVRDRSGPRIGLGVRDGNTRAAALYVRLGYRPAVPRYLDRWSYVDQDGRIHDNADPCAFLVKELV